jgi:hypothetical protein
VSPRVPWHQTPPLGMGGLLRHRVSPGTRPRLPTREGSGVTTCLMAPNPISRHGRALASPCVSWQHTPPPGTGGSGVATCPASQHGRAPASLCVPWHQAHLPAREGFGAAMCPMAPTPPPSTGGLWCHHMPRGVRSSLLTREGSGATTCHLALSVL